MANLNLAWAFGSIWHRISALPGSVSAILYIKISLPLIFTNSPGFSLLHDNYNKII